MSRPREDDNVCFVFWDMLDECIVNVVECMVNGEWYGKV